MFSGIFTESIIKRAIANEIVTINIVNFRDFSLDKHKKVDDYSFGGGPGMLLSVEPIYRALISIEGFNSAWKVLLTPQGTKYDQEIAKNYSHHEHIILICGHYEGFDDRIRYYIDEEISVGDYVLTGGEIASMAIVDSVIRLLPDALGKKESFEQDSFYDGLLEYPQYTRPQEFMGHSVPDVLISGNHQDIEKWRLEQALKRTKERRPDLLTKSNKKD
jgi:tRNA (guanine37-N1)-methyltransferase